MIEPAVDQVSFPLVFPLFCFETTKKAELDQNRRRSDRLRNPAEKTERKPPGSFWLDPDPPKVVSAKTRRKNRMKNASSDGQDIE